MCCNFFFQTSRDHKLKQCTNLILHDENYTSVVVSLLVQKWGRGGRFLFESLADKRGAYLKRIVIPGRGEGAN